MSAATGVAKARIPGLCLSPEKMKIMWFARESFAREKPLSS